MAILGSVVPQDKLKTNQIVIKPEEEEKKIDENIVSQDKIGEAKPTSIIGDVVPENKLGNIKTPVTVGDVVPENKQPVSPEKLKTASTWDKFMYGIESNIRAEKLGQVLQSYFPINPNAVPDDNQYYDKSEISKLYNMKDDELNLSSLMPDQEPKTAVKKRLEFYKNKRENYLNKAYAELTPEERQSGAAIAGEIVGSFLSPETFVPLEKLFKIESGIKGVSKFAGISGIWGAEYSLVDQLAETGTVDPKQLGKDTAIAAASGGALKGSMDLVGKGYNLIKSRPKKYNFDDLDKAEKLVGDIEYNTAVAFRNGMKQKDIPNYVKSKLRLSDQDFNKAITLSTKKFNPPTNLDEAVEIINRHTYKKPQGILGSLGKGIDTYIKPIHTRLKEIAPFIGNRLGRFESNLHQKIANYSAKVEPFFQKFKKLNKKVRKELSKDMFNGNFDELLTKLNKISPELVGDFNQVRSVLDNLYNEMVDAGVKVDYIKNYFPRDFVDRDKFLNYLADKYGRPQANKLQQLLDERATKLGLDSSGDLPADEYEKITSNFFKGRMPAGSAAPKFTKQRKIAELVDEDLEYYQNPADALLDYIRGAVNNVEQRRFFGGNGVSKSGILLDMDESIANLKMTENLGLRADEVKDLLKARFGDGEEAVGAGTSFTKNLIYGTHLGNIESALVQVGDMGISAYVNGFKNSIISLVEQAAGRSKITPKMLGLNNITAEISTTKGMAKMLDSILNVSQFQRLDRVGKTTHINAALRRAVSQLKTQKGTDAFRRKYGGVFGSELDNLINDLKTGNISDNVKYYAFSELAEIQPISLSQMPQKYLNMKGGRVFYALKSFTLKQFDLVRKTIFQEAARGNYAKAGYNAVRYLTFVTGLNTGVDTVKRVMHGKEIGMEEFKDDYVNNALKILGASRYVTDRLVETGKINETLIDMVMPPFDFIGNIASDLYELSGLKEQEGMPSISDKPHRFKSIKNVVPFGGNLIYNYFGGGLEDYQKKQYQEFKKRQ